MKDRKVEVRLSQEELFKLDMICTKYGKKRSEVIRVLMADKFREVFGRDTVPRSLS